MYSNISQRQMSWCARFVYRSLDQGAAIYGWLMTTFGQEKAYAGMKDPENRVVELYHGELGNCTQKRIVRRFTQPSSLRCVVATIAFGMGIEVTDVRLILHWGPSKTVLDYWQEVGRCGRDGSPAKAIMYLPPYSVNSR